MSATGHRGEENDKIFKNDSEEFLLPKILNDSFLNKENLLNLGPLHGEEAPSSLSFPFNESDDGELSELFYILNPINGILEEAEPNLYEKDNEEYSKFEESLDFVPAKRQKKELTVYEETLLNNFSTEIAREQELLAKEHEMKMKLWDLEMQTSQQQHALKMAILKEKLEKVQQERRNLESTQNLKHLSKFNSGPI